MGVILYITAYIFGLHFDLAWQSLNLSALLDIDKERRIGKNGTCKGAIKK